jgi:hypothetical protein
MEHGVQVFLNGEWLFIPAVDRQHADALQQKAVDDLTHVPVYSRRATRLEDGTVLTVHATE